VDNIATSSSRVVVPGRARARPRASSRASIDCSSHLDAASRLRDRGHRARVSRA
jgi:hypothetical protein